MDVAKRCLTKESLNKMISMEFKLKIGVEIKRVKMLIKLILYVWITNIMIIAQVHILNADSALAQCCDHVIY